MEIKTFAYRPDRDSSDYAVVYVRLAAEPEDDKTARPPAHLSLALDISSSMGGQPLMAAIDAIRELVGHLDASDRLGLVVFDRSARTIANPTEMTEEAKNDLLQQLDSLRPGVGTNLADGYRLAGEQLSSAFVPGGQPRILLLTDGYPSVGPSSAAHFHHAAREFLGRGIATATIGFGLRYDDTLMEGVARAGDGAYHFVAYNADLASVLASELRAAHQVEATDAVVKLIPGAEVKGIELLHRYLTRTEPDGLVVEVGSVGHLGPRKLLFVARGGSNDLGRIRVSWNPIEGEPLGGVVLPVRLEDNDDPELEREARREAILLQIAKEERRAWDYLLRGQPRQARSHVDSALESINRLLGDNLGSSREAQNHRRRLEDAIDVVEGRLEREAAFLLSQAFTARISTSMVVARPGALSDRDDEDGVPAPPPAPWAPKRSKDVDDEAEAASEDVFTDEPSGSQG